MYVCEASCMYVLICSVCLSVQYEKYVKYMYVYNMQSMHRCTMVYHNKVLTTLVWYSDRCTCTLSMDQFSIPIVAVLYWNSIRQPWTALMLCHMAYLQRTPPLQCTQTHSQQMFAVGRLASRQPLHIRRASAWASTVQIPWYTQQRFFLIRAY